MSSPFTLYTLVHVPILEYENSHLSKIDDRSGYDHVLLFKNSQQQFGCSTSEIFKKIGLHSPPQFFHSSMFSYNAALYFVCPTLYNSTIHWSYGAWVSVCWRNLVGFPMQRMGGGKFATLWSTLDNIIFDSLRFL